MTNTTAPEKKYAARAARRLDALLTEMSAPADLSGRSAWLARKLSVDEQRARFLLGGNVHWDFQVLDLMCTAFEKQPGYFLDERPENIPSDTQLVTSVNAGDSLVLRPPEGLVPPDLPQGRWRYGSEGPAPALFPLRSLLVYSEPLARAFEVRSGWTYAIDGDDGVEFMRCINVRGSVATFKSDSRGSELVLPQPSGRTEHKPARSIAGPVFLTVQPAAGAQ